MENKILNSFTFVNQNIPFSNIHRTIRKNGFLYWLFTDLRGNEQIILPSKFEKLTHYEYLKAIHKTIN